MPISVQPLQPSASRVGAAAAVFLAYVPVYFALHGTMRGAGALVTVPVIAAAWLLGWKGGLGAALAAMPLNVALYGGWGEVARLGGAPGMLAMIPIGLMVGRLRELNERVKLQMAERSRMEADLAAVERRRMEAESTANLMRASRLAAVGSLAASLAHEINNPLAFVMSNLRFASEHLASDRALGSEDGEEARAALAEALDGLMRIQSVVAGIRDVSSGADHVEQAVDVCSVVDSAIKVLQAGPAQHARLEVAHQHAPHARPFVRANHGRLSQALLNLLTNAFEALPGDDARRQTVRVCTRLQGGRVSIEISDSGRGIPPEVAVHLFQPFFTTKPPGGGAGLGLYVSRNILHAAGGELTYTTEVGVGSTFRIDLPVLETLAPAPPTLQ